MQPHRQWLSAFTIAIVIILAGLGLAVANGSVTLVSLDSSARSIYGIAWRILFYAGPISLLCAALLARREDRRLLLAVFIAAVIYTALDISRAYWFEPLPFFRSIFSRILMTIQLATEPQYLIMLALLLVVRFRGNGEYLRFAAIGSVLVMTALNCVEYWLIGPTMQMINTVGLLTALCFVAAAAWLVAFRQAPRQRPPIDAGRIIALTCPRCQTSQQISAGHGQCANCRLQITISLNEGVCTRCNYPLRGLTGDKCPECGTPIVAASETAPAAALIPSGTQSA